MEKQLIYNRGRKEEILWFVRKVKIGSLLEKLFKRIYSEFI